MFHHGTEGAPKCHYGYHGIIPGYDTLTWYHIIPLYLPYVPYPYYDRGYVVYCEGPVPVVVCERWWTLNYGASLSLPSRRARTLAAWASPVSAAIW